MTPAQEQKLLDRIAAADRKIEAAKQERHDLIVRARDEGITWRRLADALGMTVEGVMRIIERARKSAAK